MDLDFILTFVFKFLPLIFALFCLYYTFYFLKAARIIEDNPISKIRSAAQGYGYFEGKAQPLFKEQPLYGILTQKPCAWYQYKVEQWVTTSINSEGGSKATWVVLEQGVSQDPFLLIDGAGGACVVLPQNAAVFPTGKIRWRGHSRIASKPPTSFLLWLLWSSFGRFQYTEYRIELNAPIFINGYFYSLPSQIPEIQNNVWLQRYVTQTQEKTLNLLTRNLQNKSESFIISTLKHQRLTQRFRIQALLFFIAFLIFVTLAIHNAYPWA